MPSDTRRLPITPIEAEVSATKKAPLPVPVVSQDGDLLVLHFESDYIQSQMVVNDPEFLALAYTRTMMAFELFTPGPAHIALIGLGGGSIAKWCYRHHPMAEITVVEINPHVIAVRDVFQIPRDDARFRIVCEDGAKFVTQKSARFDVLLVDCFSTDHLPPELCSQAFYDHCRASLTESGLLVVNLCGKSRRNILSRIHKSFRGQTLLSTDRDGNTVVFACNGRMLWSKAENAASFQRRVGKFVRKHGLGRALAPAT
jgi:spermidine synthase